MRYSPENIVTVLMLACTVWLIVARFYIRPDSNWPPVYYTLMVVYHQAMPGRLDPMIVYAAVIGALFLRFEFMGGWFLRFVRAVDFVILCLLGLQLYQAVYI